MYNTSQNRKIVEFIRQIYKTKDTISLHAPKFVGKEKQYLNECIDSSYVSYVGEFVTKFEGLIRDYTGAKYACATVNGTAALHTALLLIGAGSEDLVLTQALTFIATANAISYVGAKPIFIDSDKKTLGMSVEKLAKFLKKETVLAKNGLCYHRKTKKKIAVCLPTHIFGHPVEIEKIVSVCNLYNIPVIEDAAESLGSFYRGKHTGTFGKIGALSFNGNKIVTTGGGGMLITSNESLAKRAKHITTTAKVPHPWKFIHDEVGYNYRMPNVNAAIGCAQMEQLNDFLHDKRGLALQYEKFFASIGITFIKEPKNCSSNYWLNTIVLGDEKEKDMFLEFSNKNGVMTRPVWTLLNKLPMYRDCLTTDLPIASWLEERLVNIPSSVRLKKYEI